MVIGIVIGLTAMTIFALGNSAAMARASRAEAAMRMIESARLSFLSDNPQVQLTAVTGNNLDPYIPGGLASATAILDDMGYTIRIPGDIQTPRLGYAFARGNPLPLKGFERR